MMFDIVTLFPGMFFGAMHAGVLGRGRRMGLVGVRLHDLRRWGVGPHQQVDDTPYGGGGGMLLKPEPFYEAVESIRRRKPESSDRVVLLSPQGAKLNDKSARRLAGYSRVILLCGRYEGVDERVRAGLADEELSVGDVVLSGGELAAMMVVEAVSRFIPGVLGRSGSAESDSFADGGLGSPYYTRPADFRGRKVPDVLLSGDHGAIARWRAQMAREATRIKRPDLLDVGVEGDGHGAPARRGRGSR